MVAGDTFADALAAASLSDPLDRSEQPRLTRVASADPEFDRIGDVDRVDTAFAPIVVTTSARSGATALAETAHFTADDLIRGGCTAAREAILVGGTQAVPRGAEAELVAMGYTEVFRVAGTNRYQTAAEIAHALGVGRKPAANTPCADPAASDGTALLGWYGNATAEYRSSADTCVLLPQSVVLADGTAGIDALAAGWWTSHWQVPVLLTGPGGSLPPATRGALESLPVDTIIKLGGNTVIPEASLEEARLISGASRVGTIAGPDRYATSVEMAKSFGGWFPGTRATFANDILCTAASSGSSGWPDSLAAGPWCARLGVTRTPAPTRPLPPLSGPEAQTATGGGTGGHNAVPVLLAPVGGGLAAPVATFLREVYAADRCTGSSAERCSEPGFAAIAGGAVGEPAVAQLGDILGGIEVRENPVIPDAFVTRLDLAPVFATAQDLDGPRACFPDDGVRGTQWLTFSPDPDRRSLLSVIDVLAGGWYQDGATRARCVSAPSASAASLTAIGSGGRQSPVLSFDLEPASGLGVSGPILQAGDASDQAGMTRWSFRQRPQDDVNLVRGPLAREVQEASLTLDLDLRDGLERVAFEGTVALTLPTGVVTGTLRGVALRSGSGWELAGVSRLGSLGVPMRGGFRASVSGSGATPSIEWRIDGLPTT